MVFSSLPPGLVVCRLLNILSELKGCGQNCSSQLVLLIGVFLPLAPTHKHFIMEHFTKHIFPLDCDSKSISLLSLPWTLSPFLSPPEVRPHSHWFPKWLQWNSGPQRSPLGHQGKGWELRTSSGAPQFYSF